MQARGGPGLASEYLSRTANNNRASAATRGEIEQTRAAGFEGALTAQYQGQSGAVAAMTSDLEGARLMLGNGADLSLADPGYD